MNLTSSDIHQLEAHELSVPEAERQLERFEKGFMPITLKAAATPTNGITCLSESDVQANSAKYDKEADNYRITKFVPASGAATRMFKALFTFLDSQEISTEIERFEQELANFAFFDQLSQTATSTDLLSLVDTLLHKLHYGKLPKALIAFHKYKNMVRTPLDEHLVEGALYASSGGQVDIHFSVSEQHRVLFDQHFDHVKPSFENQYKVHYNLSTSIQQPSTDTLGVNLDNSLFRTEGDKLVFRPAGHGALLVNLNLLDSDMVFIKNIDNVQQDHLKETTVLYKKALAGKLLSAKKDVEGFRNLLNDTTPDIETIEHQMKDMLNIDIPFQGETTNIAGHVQHLLSLLNRPIRVCGMVKNEGEPGGGPYWVEKNGRISLQIVEKSQVDFNDPGQEAIFNQATHFNPVDIVCWMKDEKGNSFDLTKFTDPDTGFITEKSMNGKPLKAMEMPGLWNGAMADWITVFVEVPSTTFSPVKTVNDLLRPEHQPPS